MNKKAEAWLEGELAKIIIAVICITFLVYFGVLVYSGFRDKNQGKQAEATLEEINLKIDKMELGEETSYLYLSPENYYFYSSDDNNKISKCLSRYCLCLCKDKNCKDFSVCKNTNKVFLLKDFYDDTLIGKKIDAPRSYILTKSEMFYILKEATKDE